MVGLGKTSRLNLKISTADFMFVIIGDLASQRGRTIQRPEAASVAVD